MSGIDASGAPVPHETVLLEGGTLWTLLAPGHDALRCPLVVVEGFPGGHGFGFSWGVVAQQGVLAKLQAAGWDLVVIGLADGRRSIADNAAVLSAGLEIVRARTPLPIAVLGWSMGGLIARIALADLEAAGVDHHVTTLITWDTPHRGTVTQLGVQWLVAHLAARVPALQPFATLLGSVANQEMDIVWLDADGHAGQSPARTALLARLRWPSQPRRVLISCGRGDGEVTLDPGRVLLHWHGGEQGEIVLRSAGGGAPIASGRFGGHELPTLSGDAFAGVAGPGLGAVDGLPGGREQYPAQAAAVLGAVVPGAPPIAPPPPATCTVPAWSALDSEPAGGLDVGSPDAIVCATDQPHLVIDAAAAPQIIAAIGSPFDPDAFDPHGAAFLTDPFPTYAAFRRWAPMHPVKAYGSLWCFGSGVCDEILTGTDQWLKSPAGGTPPRPGPLAAMDAFEPGLFSADPPSHTGMRAAVEPLIIAAAQRAPEIARAHAEQLLSGLVPRGRVELLQDYALPLPAAVLFDLLGLEDDPAMRQTLMTWQAQVTIAHDSGQSVAVRFGGLTAEMAQRTFWTGLVRRHRASPRAGLLGELVDAFAAARLDDQLLYATLCDLLVAGYASTTFLIATGTWRLLQHPDALAALRADRTLVPKGINELLRLDGPVQVIDRFAAADTTLGGQAITAGTKVTAVIGSADRDPAAHADPDTLRLDRTEWHRAFGRGIHTCVGGQLVEQVAPVAFAALLDLGVLELDGEPQWQADPYLRAVTSLPLRIGS